MQELQNIQDSRQKQPVERNIRAQLLNLQ